MSITVSPLMSRYERNFYFKLKQASVVSWCAFKDKVGRKGLLLAKFGPEDVNKHRLQNILVMLRTAATENAKVGFSEALSTVSVRC